MYKKSFYIEENIWNNSLSYEKRENKKLYVPSIIYWWFDDITLQFDKEKVAFEDFWFDWKLAKHYWLRNFYRIKWKDKEIILFDNHNHALYFWYETKNKWLIKDNTTLIHIDEHADMRDPEEYLSNDDFNDLEKVFNYTNFSKVNVGNYIIPAQKQWLIWQIKQIRNTTNLEEYLDYKNSLNWDIILNLDLDFFQPDLDFIDYELKKKVVLDAASKAHVITVSTSPFFIDQDLAVRVFRDIFDN